MVSVVLSVRCYVPPSQMLPIDDFYKDTLVCEKIKYATYDFNKSTLVCEKIKYGCESINMTNGDCKKLSKNTRKEHLFNLNQKYLRT